MFRKIHVFQKVGAHRLYLKILQGFFAQNLQVLPRAPGKDTQSPNLRRHEYHVQRSPMQYQLPNNQRMNVEEWYNQLLYQSPW